MGEDDEVIGGGGDVPCIACAVDAIDSSVASKEKILEYGVSIIIVVLLSDELRCSHLSSWWYV